MQESIWEGEWDMEMTGMLPHFTSLQEALSALFGNGIQAVRHDRVSGGDINEAYSLLLNNGMRIFMKANTKQNLSFFQAEAAGLSAIAKTGTAGTPRMLGMGTDEGRGGFSFLLMELVQAGKKVSGYWEVFARQLADMHRSDTGAFVSGGLYGFLQDNYIGANRQVNTSSGSWIDFFRECRLEPQVRSAARYFEKAELKKISMLLEHTDSILTEPEFPSLLHGDLWAGNVMTGNDGRAWLIDPAAYVGHAEADLAMTELFGGFPQDFYRAYQEALPLQPGYDRRRDFYNLYHLLNHLNLFGVSYLSPVRNVIRKYADTLS